MGASNSGEVGMFTTEDSCPQKSGQLFSDSLCPFGAKDRYKWLSDSFPVNILGNCLSPTDVVRNLGVLFDAKFCFTNLINSVIKSCFISLRDLYQVSFH